MKKTFSVPINITYDGYAYVEAESAEAAKRLVEEGIWFDSDRLDMIDHAVTGEAVAYE